MKKLNKRSIGKKVIKSEISALNLTQSRLDSSFEKACDAILKCAGKVITIGLGKSGYIAAKSAATFSFTKFKIFLSLFLILELSTFIELFDNSSSFNELSSFNSFLTPFTVIP